MFDRPGSADHHHGRYKTNLRRKAWPVEDRMSAMLVLGPIFAPRDRL
jgi:hypothetical protein